MGKVLKDRKTILRTFMSNLKAKKQADDSKGSYQKAQERVIARKTALARKRARETAAKHQAALKAVIEDDKLLPNQEGTGTSGCYGLVSDQGAMGSSQGYALARAVDLQYRIKQQLKGDSGTSQDPLVHPTLDPLDQKLLEVQQKLHDFATNALDTPDTGTTE